MNAGCYAVDFDLDNWFFEGRLASPGPLVRRAVNRLCGLRRWQRRG